jgi:hypothetical protein
MSLPLLFFKLSWGLKKKEAPTKKSKALNVECDLSNANDKSNKLQADGMKCRKGYNDLACQSELTRVNKDLTSTKKKTVEQLESTLAHKE